MCGLDSRQSVFVIAATNRPKLIDPAMAGLKNHSLSHKREGEPLPIYRDCFDSGMNLVFSAKATNFKTKGQEDKLNKEKNTGSSREKEMPKVVSRIIGKQM
eukprot:scaffold46400_cov56-Attheya_sp.AAC.3